MELFKKYMSDRMDYDDSTKVISAVMSRVGEVDRDGDMMLKGCFDKALAEFEAMGLSMPFQHDRTELVGKWTSMKMEGDDLVGEGEIFTDVGKGADAVKLIQRNVIRGVSLGFRARSWDAMEFFDRDEGNEERCSYGYDFSDVVIVECSLVDNPALMSAQISEIRQKALAGLVAKRQSAGMIGAMNLLLKS